MEPCCDSIAVADVRTLGAIGVVEMKRQIDVPRAQARSHTHTHTPSLTTNPFLLLTF